MVLLGSHDECIEMCHATVIIIFAPGAYFDILAFCPTIEVSNYLSIGFKYKDIVLDMFSMGLREIVCGVPYITSEKERIHIHGTYSKLPSQHPFPPSLDKLSFSRGQHAYLKLFSPGLLFL